ncbi:hypothetical protein F5Y19DRAFT_396436 [Xylariaceae sp. FL1651]|nr:hypothetical protein F5Y19DRAFT_396436 [Xylariaceae sp. FL1651]
MLSNPPVSGLHARHRQHRRQNSTPTTYEALKIAPNLPTTQQSSLHQHQHQSHERPRVSHRRGMSLDTRRQIQSPIRQEFSMVSNPTNNTGLANSPQQVVREAQQQRLARPGPQQAYANLATDENYLVSPHATPQIHSFDQQWCDGLPVPSELAMTFDMYNGPMNVIIKKNQDGYVENLTSPDFDLFPPTTLSTPTFMNFPNSSTSTPGWISENETANSRRSSRRISNGIMDRVSKFENMGLEPSQRPLTPPRQNETDYFPLTPMETPQGRTAKHGQPPQRFLEGYDESNEETVKPLRQPANRRSQTTFDEMRQATEEQTMMPEARRANTMPTNGAFDSASTSAPDCLAVDQRHSAELRVDTNCDGFTGTSYPLSASSEYSQHISPITPSLAGFPGGFDFKTQLDHQNAATDITDVLSDEAGSLSTERPSCRGSPHRRTESVASLASAASIASIDIEKTKTTTGITTEDIQQYIQGPDPRDNKWVCTFEDCNKKFGRKENIKSHVQTHLNDRQYKCPVCQKCFVRQHDLKRHAKIHTGIKPYPCECGNSFARHDALTRHRQRGMCIGAFDGIVKKIVKRGRPRKPRPDNDERRDKATRTRRKNKSTSSASSQSGYSDSSAVNSPESHDNDFDMLDDIMDVSLGGTTMNPSSLQSLGSSTAPMPTLVVDPSSSVHSPSAGSVHSYVSQLSHMSLHPEQAAEALPSHPNSPTKSVASPANDPPELSQVSSPPSSHQYFDTEQNSSGLDLMISAVGDTSTIPSMMGMTHNDNDVLLGCDSHMLMFDSEAKFEESYDGVHMFTSNDDLIFGNS